MNDREIISDIAHSIKVDGYTSEQKEFLTSIVARLGCTTPPLPVQPQRQWVGLTGEERNEIWKKEVGWGDPSHDDEDLMKAIEQALKDKNT